MAEGVRSTQIEQASMVDEVLANVTVDGIAKTVRMPAAALGAQIAQGAGAIVAKQVKATFAQLDAVKNSMSTGDVGLVVFDPNDALRGQYALEGGVLVKKAELTETQSQQYRDETQLLRNQTEALRDEAIEAAPSTWEDLRDQTIAARQTAVQEAGRAEGQADRAEAASANAQGAARSFALWSALAAVTGTIVAEGAEVLDDDTGTHTDPVVGGVVPNGGRYSWSSSPAGWRRIGNTGLLSKTSAKSVSALGENGIAFVDPAGNVALVASTARLETPLIKVTPALVDHPDINAIREAVPGQPQVSTETGVIFQDPSGNPALVATSKRLEAPTFVATDDEIVHPAFQALQSEVAYIGATSAERYASLAALVQWAQIMVVGQSLARGGGANPAISTVALSAALRFNGGTGWVSDDFASTDIPARHASVEALYENGRESPSYGIAQMLQQLAVANGFSFGDAAGQRLLLSNPAVSGSSVAQLLDPDRFQFPKADITYGKSLADAAGKSVGLIAMPVIQGEGDYFGEGVEWVSKWLTFKERIRLHAASVYGFDRDFITPVYQQAYTGPSRDIDLPLAQLDLAQEEGWCLSTPIYFLEKVADGTHLTPLASKLLGAYKGRAIFEWLWLGRRPRSLVPSNSARLGNVVAVQFPVKTGLKLEFDTTQVPLATNYGFELFQADGVTAIPITNVSVTGRDTVTIRTGGAVPANAVLIYGRNGNGTADTVNLRSYSFGNLRDNDPLIFDPTGINKPMRNWAPIFRKVIL